MSVHVSDWDACLVLGAERVSLGPQDPTLPGPDIARQGCVQSACRARRARAERGQAKCKNGFSRLQIGGYHVCSCIGLGCVSGFGC